MKYEVCGKIVCYVYITVQAESLEEAMKKADEKFGGVTSYCGNGGYDKLIGVNGSKESIDGDSSEVEWKSAQEI